MAQGNTDQEQGKAVVTTAQAEKAQQHMQPLMVAPPPEEALAVNVGKLKQA